jgi:hypothetical protein
MSFSADSDSLLFVDQAPHGCRQPLARVWEDSVAKPNLCAQTGTGSHSNRHYLKKLGIDQLFSRPRTPNDTPRTLAPAASAGVDALFGTIKSQPVYSGSFAADPTAVTCFTGF